MFKTGYFYLEVSLPDSESVFLLLLWVGPQTVADATDNDDNGKSAHARQDNNYGPRNWKQDKLFNKNNKNLKIHLLITVQETKKRRKIIIK